LARKQRMRTTSIDVKKNMTLLDKRLVKGFAKEFPGQKNTICIALSKTTKNA